MTWLLNYILITDDIPVLYALHASCIQTDRHRGQQRQEQYPRRSIVCVSDTKKIQNSGVGRTSSSFFVFSSSYQCFFSSSWEGLLDCWSTIRKKCHLPATSKHNPNLERRTLRLLIVLILLMLLWLLLLLVVGLLLLTVPIVIVVLIA